MVLYKGRYSEVVLLCITDSFLSGGFNFEMKSAGKLLNVSWWRISLKKPPTKTSTSGLTLIY